MLTQLMQNYTYVDPTIDPLLLFAGLILLVAVVVGSVAFAVMRPASTASTEPKTTPEPAPEPFVPTPDPTFLHIDAREPETAATDVDRDNVWTDDWANEDEGIGPGGTAVAPAPTVATPHKEASTHKAETEDGVHVLHMN